MSDQPDSWEDEADQSLPQQIAKVSLNPNASEWKPNFSAKEFVPSWATQPAVAPAPQATPDFESAPVQPGMYLFFFPSHPNDERVPRFSVFLTAICSSSSCNPAPAKVLVIGPTASTSVPEKKAEPTAAAALKKADLKPPSRPDTPTSAAKRKEAALASTDDPTAKAVDLHMEINAVDEEIVADLYGKEHLNVVFMGHVDAGKSTMGGNILYLTGMVDKRTMEKYEKEAKEAGRESWYLSWALDTNTEERAKGKTVETGRAYFETEKRRYTILDAPGHQTFVPSMIAGASQADIGVLVISARKGEFETGFERGGQTREHAMLAKTSGVNKLIVAVNKMDDPTVQWDKARYVIPDFYLCLRIGDRRYAYRIENAHSKYPHGYVSLNQARPISRTTYNLTSFHFLDITYIPVSGYTGANIKDRADKALLPWFEGPSLLEQLDGMQMLDRKIDAPLKIPITMKYKNMGTIVVGKIESGKIKKGTNVILMPNRKLCEVTALYNDTEDEVPHAVCGDNVRIRLRGVEEEEVSSGFVLCDVKSPIKTTTVFEAQLAILEHKNIICAGYTAVLHVHSAVEEITVTALLNLIDKKTNRRSKRPPQFVKQGQKAICRIEAAGPICVERFEDHPQLGRFTLRDEGKTIAIGKITKVIEAETDAQQ
ncbi:eukaryotic release factor 3 [Endogone sp. FLAS-F59071]|nr:eukaryotic release factor 3 [Endogone sp. FLAS-F59071]|eukprot:RUS14256.1 eukaryotic release factor 3 [Endogone sp. FLAS-F59071]